MRIKFIFIVVFLFIQGISFAQETTKDASKEGDIDFNFGVDIMSRYVWRGTQFGGTSPSIQPGVSFSYKNFEIGTWGAYSVGGENTVQEFDLYLAYTFANDMITAKFTDYYFPDDSVDYKYFDYDENTTGHIFEGSVSFNGTESIPLTFLAAINFYGADAIKLNNDSGNVDFNKRSGIQYSTYFELGYGTTINETNLNVFLGFTLNNLKGKNLETGFIGETGFYGEKAGIVNLGLTAVKDINVSEKFSIPVTASVITNPMSEKVFFVFGFSF